MRSLPQGLTVACEDRDFREWRRGVRRYGFWAVLPERRDWIRRFGAGAARMGPFTLPGYRRAPHVTVWACGLLSPRTCPSARIRAQARALAAARIPPFRLRLGGLGTFASAAYLRILDPEGGLARLRGALAAVAPEDAPYAYVPHLTVGLYAGAFPLGKVRGGLRAFRGPKAGPLLVREVAFCTYEARSLQGPFAVRLRIPLGHGLCGKFPGPPGTQGASGGK